MKTLLISGDILFQMIDKSKPDMFDKLDVNLYHICSDVYMRGQTNSCLNVAQLISTCLFLWITSGVRVQLKKVKEKLN